MAVHRKQGLPDVQMALHRMARCVHCLRVCEHQHPLAGILFPRSDCPPCFLVPPFRGLRSVRVRDELAQEGGPTLVLLGRAFVRVNQFGDHGAIHIAVRVVAPDRLEVACRIQPCGNLCAGFLVEGEWVLHFGRGWVSGQDLAIDRLQKTARVLQEKGNSPVGQIEKVVVQCGLGDPCQHRLAWIQ